MNTMTVLLEWLTALLEYLNYHAYGMMGDGDGRGHVLPGGPFPTDLPLIIALPQFQSMQFLKVDFVTALHSKCKFKVHR